MGELTRLVDNPDCWIQVSLNCLAGHPPEVTG
jgi:hypothetical protein